MHDDLKRINDTLAEHDRLHEEREQFKAELTAMNVMAMNPQEREEFIAQYRYPKSKYQEPSINLDDIYGELNQIAHTFSVDEMVDAYWQGGIHLRSFITGHIMQNPDEAYVPMMTQAIYADHPVAYRFLAITITENYIDRDQIIELVRHMFKSHHYINVDTALGGVRTLKLIELLDDVVLLESHHLESIADDARQTRNEIS